MFALNKVKIYYAAIDKIKLFYLHFVSFNVNLIRIK